MKCSFVGRTAEYKVGGDDALGEGDSIVEILEYDEDSDAHQIYFKIPGTNRAVYLTFRKSELFNAIREYDAL